MIQTIIRKCMAYVQQINKLVCNFSFVNKSLLYNLDNTYCTSLYCCQSLDLARLSTSSLQTAWNKCIRRIWNLPLNTHTKYLPFICNDLKLSDHVYIRFMKMFLSMLHNNNKNVSFLAQKGKRNTVGTLGRNCNVIYSCLGVDFTRIDSCHYQSIMFSPDLY